MATKNELLEAALEYARRGLYVVPLHNPLFDDTGLCVGCSCEEWERSKNPDFVCPPKNRGKHPRLAEWEQKATTDKNQIRSYWRSWPAANVGIAAGKSGLLCLDYDKYKETAGELPMMDRETVTSLTGGGGEHLIYRIPEGVTWGNSAAGLPEGIDVRCHGGQFVAPPSRHLSGRLYEWEGMFSFADLDPLPVPEVLATILEAANAPGAVPEVTFADATGKRPDIGRWKLPTVYRVLIEHGHPAGAERSDTDQSVITALLQKGASAGDIQDIFAHYPIGQAGKYGEKGRAADKYLAHSIANAQAFLAENKREFAANGDGPESPQVEDTGRDADEKSKGILTADFERALSGLGYSFRYNEVLNNIELNGGIFHAGQDATIRNQLYDQGLKGEKRIDNVLLGLAWRDRYHPIRAYLEGLTWDGVDHFTGLMRHLGLKDGNMARRLIWRWLLGAVGKAYGDEPNLCLISDGRQGIGKSYLIRWLVPAPLAHYFRESPIRPDTKDDRIAACENWIWEVTELQATTRKADQEALKGFLTHKTNRDRVPYGKQSAWRLTLASFWGTVNENGAGFLTDTTGNRRFAIIRLSGIDYHYTGAVNLAGLWAQVFSNYRAGERGYLDQEEQDFQREQMADYMASDPVEEYIWSYYQPSPGDTRWILASDIMNVLKESGLRVPDLLLSKRLSEILTAAGAEKGRPRVGGSQVTAYRGIIKNDDIIPV